MVNEEIILYILETFNNGYEIKENIKFSEAEMERHIRILRNNDCVKNCYQDVTGAYCADGLTPIGKELLNKLTA